MEFRNRYWFLNNKYPCQVEIELPTGRYTFDNAEAAFQATKNPTAVESFLGVDGFMAERIGDQIVYDEEWSEHQEEYMAAIVEAKFAQNPGLMKDLLAIQGTIFNEVHNDRKDAYWGVYKELDHTEGITREPVYVMRGDNRLGKILMNIREKYKKHD